MKKHLLIIVFGLLAPSIVEAMENPDKRWLERGKKLLQISHLLKFVDNKLEKDYSELKKQDITKINEHLKELENNTKKLLNKIDTELQDQLKTKTKPELERELERNAMRSFMSDPENNRTKYPYRLLSRFQQMY